MKRFKNIKTQMMVAAGALSLSGAAFAEGPDAAAVVAVIAGFSAFVGAVGGAMVLITVAKKAWNKVGG